MENTIVGSAPMIDVSPPAVASDLAEAIRRKLVEAQQPLKLAEVKKGLKAPPKTKPTVFQRAVEGILDDHVRLGLAFRHPSAKDGMARFWSRDEHHLLGERAVEIATEPKTLANLKKELTKDVKGVDGAFVESIIRELISEERLFEHPPATVKGGPLFGASRAPSPLLQKKNAAAFAKLVDAAKKLLRAAGVSASELVQHLGERLSSVSERTTVSAPIQHSTAEHPGDPKLAGGSELEELILKAVANDVLTIKELRESMPKEYRGKMFDETVLRLAHRQKVAVFCDIEVSNLTPENRAECVVDGGAVYTTITKRD